METCAWNNGGTNHLVMYVLKLIMPPHVKCLLDRPTQHVPGTVAIFN